MFLKLLGIWEEEHSYMMSLYILIHAAKLLKLSEDQFSRIKPKP